MNGLGIIAGTAGSILGNISKDDPQEYANQQMWNDLHLMGVSQQYNLEAAEKSQQLGMEMWDYTNYENQVKHMKEAGLNPALLYGKAGGGGATTAGGKMEGAKMANSQAVGMALTAKQIEAQTRLQNAQAVKTIAEAEKIQGPDTDLAKSEIDLNKIEMGVRESMKNLNDATTKLRNQEEQVSYAVYFRTIAEEKELWQKVRIAATNADISEETKEATVQKAIHDTNNTIIAGLEGMARIQFTEEQTNFVKTEIRGYWAKLANETTTAEAKKQEAETLAKRLTEEVKKWGKEIDQRDEQLLMDWIYRGVHSAAEVSAEIRKWIKPF